LPLQLRSPALPMASGMDACAKPLIALAEYQVNYGFAAWHGSLASALSRRNVPRYLPTRFGYALLHKLFTARAAAIATTYHRLPRTAFWRLLHYSTAQHCLPRCDPSLPPASMLLASPVIPVSGYRPLLAPYRLSVLLGRPLEKLALKRARFADYPATRSLRCVCVLGRTPDLYHADP